MWTRKRVLAVLSVAMLIGLMLLPYVQYGPVLQDEEFDNAVKRAATMGIQNTDVIREYPFSPIARREAAVWYVLFAQHVGLVPILKTCVFEDLDSLSPKEQDMLKLSCKYGFFHGVQGSFYPDQWVTKGASLVALIRGMMPGKYFPEAEPYRDPYVTEAYLLGITKRETGPYLEYAITRYELILQLYRAAQIYAER